ncbi:class Ib ribonucleoside-diphosphate reductase assembly flavoprotein NrdI [Leuconostoc carnosum]|uniref:Ribonucleotide reductase protein NrdI n=2 Tax=Leuconostoc carnosum TaxID=1252 RepID=K0D8G1_LEUCJ|nr:MULTISPECIES: class Ib ribonucleoside-diphosphate reductase assembly flavoprotein NrdI [Leuconostoc]AFT81115.1 ribonucleotide reductase protein NrdI [Leuconostoc carnosum JB16]KAA8326455.1 class Ib ribonucleoside-diphosphate reductase assembly flavoprotein NrdI [Leuconostoc carnosum]KAA8330712.1 class Ib ribonucleoside-diphosphate reductase assembly flavoprotein NrdI [Leuconostoc carnosum]KAA8362015.1 class Ib ribonucleoside-diphosphate reductase assembly flavoprotein NrdI [Leuconostoc carno
MTKINVLYASTEGNTISFVEKLKSITEANGDEFSSRLIGDETDYANETEPYIAIVPTYLNGGTGTGPEVTEIFTNALGDYISFGRNSAYLKGIVGSGNRNFNVQFNLTGLRYAQKFGVPMLFAYELRGSQFDAEKVYNIIKPLFGE